MRKGWKEGQFGSSSRRLGPGLHLTTHWSVNRGEGYIGNVFGNKLKKSSGNLDEVQEACEKVAQRLLQEALEKLKEQEGTDA